jgi:hypothetical protein
MGAEPAAGFDRYAISASRFGDGNVFSVEAGISPRPLRTVAVS